MTLQVTWQKRLTAFARDGAIVVAVSLGLLLSAEIALRLFWPQELTGTPLRGEPFAGPDSVLGMRYTPGAVWRFTSPEYSVVYAINNDGFRDTGEQPSSPGAPRILLLGDSFTFGQGVNADETWAALAERQLRSQGHAFDMINAGVQGMDTRSELVLLRRLARQHDVDAVVVGFLINDLYTNEADVPAGRSGSAAEEDGQGDGKTRPSVYRRIGDLQGLHLVALARRLVSSLDAVYIALYLAHPGRGNYLRVPLSEAAGRQLQITDMLFRQMAALCDSIGKPLVVLSIPQQFQVLYVKAGRRSERVVVDYYDRHFARLADSTGFTWVASLPDMVDAARGPNELFHRIDGHLTAYGNAALAKVFMRRVVVPLFANDLQ